MAPPLKIEEVKALVRAQSAENLDAMNHGITLKDTLVAPRLISVIARTVRNGRKKDENLSAWLVGQENGTDGYLTEPNLRGCLSVPSPPFKI